jgi:conjugal transfer pilus assembly protein TraI
VWFGADGLFIVWPNAAMEIRSLLESDEVPGIPTAPETILAILVAAGVFEAQDSSRTTWQITPPGSKTFMEAVKLSSPAVLFAGIDSAPKPLTVLLLRASAGSSAPSSSIAPAASAETSGNAGDESSRGQQLRLPIEWSARVDEGVILPVPEFKLESPMRLNAAVREALAQIVDSLNRDGTDVAACTISSGVFIPLTEFERRKIEPSFALRALSEVNMLVQRSGVASRTMARDFGGEQKVGLVLSPHFVAGLDAANFDTRDV